jgi:tRNA(adenine34) deaminase
LRIKLENCGDRSGLDPFYGDRQMKKFIGIFFMMMFSLQCYASNNNVQDTHTQKQDEYYMQIAIQLAKHNPKAPFAALIVDNKTGEILGEGLNASKTNPTFHGEMVAINDCAKKHPHVDWSKVTLYTTAEPCSMCQSAIIWAGISRVGFATSIGYLKSHGWTQIDLSAAQVNSKATFYKGTLTSGILAEKADVLFNK